MFHIPLRRYIALIILTGFLSIPALPSLADEETEANRLFVSAVNAWNLAEAINDDSEAATLARLRLLRDVSRRLENILDENPGSSLSVRLTIGEQIGPLSIAAVAKELEQTRLALAKYSTTRPPCVPSLKDFACILDELYISARNVNEDRRRFSILEFLSYAQAMAGQLDQALITVFQIETEKPFEGNTSIILEEIARSGQIGKAMMVARSFISDDERASALDAIAMGLARSGQFDEALQLAQTAAKIGKKGLPDNTINEINDLKLFSVARVQAMEGSFDEAIVTARKINTVEEKISAISFIASLKNDDGYFEQAMNIARETSGKRSRESALSTVAKELAKAGRFDQALEMAQLIEDGWQRSRLHAEIAEEIAKAGRFGQAIEMAQLIEDGWLQSLLHVKIVEELAKAGHFDIAFNTTHDIINAPPRVMALATIAKYKKSASLFDQALQEARNIPSLEERAIALASVAKAKADDEILKEALAVVREIEDAESRAFLLNVILNGISSLISDS